MPEFVVQCKSSIPKPKKPKTCEKDQPQNRQQKQRKTKELVHAIPTGETRNIRPYPKTHMERIDRGYGDFHIDVWQGSGIMEE